MISGVYLTTGFQKPEELSSVRLEYYPTNGEYYTPLYLLVEPDFADEIIKACCILHNYVRQRVGASFEDMESNFLVDDLIIRGAPPRAQGIEVRDAYADYFMGPGSIPFQYKYI